MPQMAGRFLGQTVRLPFPATPQTASNRSQNASKCSRTKTHPPRSKSPLTNLSNTHQNAADLLSSFRPKPLPFYSKNPATSRPITGQAWPPSQPHAVCDLPQLSLGRPIAGNGGHVRRNAAAAFCVHTTTF